MARPAQGLAHVRDLRGRGEGYAILLLDIIMRRVNGDDMLAQLRKSGDTTPAVACTGNAMPSDIQRYETVGFAATLTKPFNVDDLAATIKRVLGMP